MNITLTKDADYFICSIYKEYLSKIEQGKPKSNAKYFHNGVIENLVPKINSADIDDITKELKSAGLITKDIIGNIVLQPDAIIYMENRFKKGLIEVTDFISKFIP